MGIPFRQRVQHRRVLPHDHKLTDLARRQDKHKQKNSKRDIVVVNGGQHDVNTSVAESLVSPDCFDIFDDLLLFSVFRHTTVFREKGYGYGRAEHVKVMILASTFRNR